MSNTETISDDAIAYSPLLIFKIGVLGCAPLDMGERLAEEYDAQYFSSDYIRKELMEEGVSKGMSPADAQRVHVRHIRDVLASRATPLLKSGEDVVIDMFHNTPITRQFPIELAHDTGALTLALSISTPFSVARERVEQWTNEESFVIPVSLWDSSPVEASRRMSKQIEWPYDYEEIDYVFNLNGSTDTEDLLDQIGVLMEHNRLLYT